MNTPTTSVPDAVLDLILAGEMLAAVQRDSLRQCENLRQRWGRQEALYWSERDGGRDG